MGSPPDPDLSDSQRTHQLPRANLTEDEIDDLLYIARTNSLEDVEPTLLHLCPKYSAPPWTILLSATDPTSGNTPLHYSAANNHLELLKTLLSEKYFGTLDSKAALLAFVNHANEAGNTALHWAALNGHLEVCKVLVSFGAEVRLVNGMGHDAIFEAERAGREDVVTWLLSEEGGLEESVGKEEEGEVAEEGLGDGEGGGISENGDGGGGNEEVEEMRMDVDVGDVSS